MSTEIEQRTLRQLARKVRLINRYGANVELDEKDDWRRGATGWTCTLRYQGRQFTFPFWQGPAVTGEPDVEGVLECLLSDANSGEQSFEDFCSELGYDPDSRKAEATWKACARSAKAMRRLLGSDFEVFLYAER